MKKSKFIFLAAFIFVIAGFVALALYDTKMFTFVPTLVDDDYNLIKMATEIIKITGANGKQYTIAVNSLSPRLLFFFIITGVSTVLFSIIMTLVFRKYKKLWIVGAVLTGAFAIGMSFLPLLSKLMFNDKCSTLIAVYLIGGIYFGCFAFFTIYLIKYLIVMLFVKQPLKKNKKLIGNMTIGIFGVSGLNLLLVYVGALKRLSGLTTVVINIFSIGSVDATITPRALLVYTVTIFVFLVAYFLLKIIANSLDNTILGAIFDVIGVLAVGGFTIYMAVSGDNTFKVAGTVFGVGGLATFAILMLLIAFFRGVNQILFGQFMEKMGALQSAQISEDGSISVVNDETGLTAEEEAYYNEQYGKHDAEDVIYEEQYVDENGNIVPNPEEVYLDMGDDENPGEEYVYGYESVDMDELQQDDSQTSEDKSPFSLSDEEFAALEAEYADYLDQIPEKKVEQAPAQEAVQEEYVEEVVEEVVEEEAPAQDDDFDEFEAFANSLNEKPAEEEAPQAAEEPVVEETNAEEAPVSETTDTPSDEAVESEEEEEEDEDDSDDLDDSEEEEAEDAEEEETVTEEPIEKKVQIKEVNLVDEDGNVRKVKKRFNTKMMFAPYEAKEYYNEIKNYLEQYRAKGRISSRCETFRYKGLVAKVALAGKSIKVCLALNPSDFENTKYHFKDVSNKKQYAEVPLMIKVRSPRSLKYFKELVDIMMANRLVKVKRNFEPTNYLTTLIPNGEAIFAQLGLSNFYLQDSMNAKGIPSDLPEDLIDYLPAIGEDPLTEDEVEANVYVDTLCTHFNDGDVVTIEALKSLHIVTDGNVLRIKARGTLDRKLVIYAEYFDDDALKMLLCTNCTVVKIVR